MGSTWWYQTGVTLTVLTSPPGRVVGLDGNEVGISDSGGKFVLERAPRKNHTLSAVHEGYQSQALTEPIGPFAFNAKVPLIMQQQTYRMTAQTRPPSSNVYVDDKLAGKSDVIALVIGIAGIAIIIPIGGLLLAHDDLKENAAATLGVVLLLGDTSLSWWAADRIWEWADLELPLWINRHREMDRLRRTQERRQGRQQRSRQKLFNEKCVRQK
jgi:hypothetical protein